MSFTIVKPTISNFKFTHNTSNIDNFCNFTRDINILYQNCPVTLSWDFNNLYTTTVDLQLWKNNTKIKTIVTNHDINQSYVFLQDSSATLINNDYYFKITDNNNIADDVSTNKFEIKKASFTNLQIPSSLTPCGSYTINWDFDLSINKVKLEIWEGNQYKEDIVSNLNAIDKSYTWNTPAKNSLVEKNLQIKIVDISSIADTFVSSNFRFNRPKFKTQTGVNTSDILHGIPFTIHWEYTLIIKSLDIYLFNSNTQQRLYTIATNYDTQGNTIGSAEFTIPLTRTDLSGAYRIEINDSNNVAINILKVVNLINPEITLFEFDVRDDKMYQGISRKINWDYKGNIKNFAIDLFDPNDNFIKNIKNNLNSHDKTVDITIDNSGTLFGSGYYFILKDISNNTPDVKISVKKISGGPNINYFEIIKPALFEPNVDNIIAQGTKYSLFLKSNGLILDNTKVELWRKGTPDNKISDVASNINITNRNSDNIVVFNENYIHSTSISFIPSVSNTIVGENFYFKTIDQNQITNDVSSNYFEIITATFTNLNIQFSSSNTSNKILQGLPSYISWVYKYTMSKIKLDLIKSDGTFIKNIINELSVNNNSLAGIRGGTFNWTPDYDDNSGNNFKIKISDVDNIVPDYSSNVFEIIPPKIKSLTVPNPIKQSKEATVSWDYSGNINNVKLQLQKINTSTLIDIGINNLTASTKTHNFTLNLDKDLHGIYKMIITDIATHPNITSYESINFTIEKPEFLTIEFEHPTPKTYDWCPDNPLQNKVYQCCPINIKVEKNDLPIDNVKVQLFQGNQFNMIKELNVSSVSSSSYQSTTTTTTTTTTFSSSNPISDPTTFSIEQSWTDTNFNIGLNYIVNNVYIVSNNKLRKFLSWPIQYSLGFIKNDQIAAWVIFMEIIFNFDHTIHGTKTCNYFRYVWGDDNGNTFKNTLFENKTFTQSESVTLYFKFVPGDAHWNTAFQFPNGSAYSGITNARNNNEIQVIQVTNQTSTSIVSSTNVNNFILSWTPEKNKNVTPQTSYRIKLLDSANIADSKFSTSFSIVKSSFTSLNIKDVNNNSVSDLSQNENYTINWDYDLSINKVSIELFKDSYIEILTSSFNAYNKSFSWKPILSNSTVGSNYKLRIKDVDDIADSLESSSFTIIKPSFTISKTGIFNKTQIILGSENTISWTYNLTVKNIKLTLVKGSNEYVIKDSINVSNQNSGNYNWKSELNTFNYNNLNGTGFFIKISDLDGFANDVSSNNFEIIVPEFKSLSTNSILYQNKQSTVTWDYDGNINSVKIDLYKNAVFQKNIKNNVDASLKTLDFTLDLSKNMVSNTNIFNLKITDLSGFSQTFFSNPFRIIKPVFNKIELFHPNIALNFCRNMTKDLLHETCPVDISWNTNGLTIDNVKLELWANTSTDPVKVKDIVNNLDTSGKDNDNYSDDTFLYRFNSSQNELSNILLQSHTNYYLKVIDLQNIANDLSSSTINIFQNVFKNITVNNLNNILITDVSQNVEVKIIWDYTVNTNNNATLDLLNFDNSVRQTLDNNLNIGDSSYNWVPDLSGTMIGNNFKVRISDNGGEGHSIISQPFTIIKPRFNISKSNIITTRVLHGLSVPISWSYLLTIKNIKLTLMKNTQTILDIINPLNINSQSSGNYNWTLPLTNTNNSDISGTNYHILMSDLSGVAIDISSNPFELIAPKFKNLSLTTPVQQEIESKILWDYSGNISNVQIELWKNTSKVKDITIYDTNNCFDCSFGWIEPNNKTLFGSGYFLKLKDISNNAHDISTNLFQIIKPQFKLINIDHANLNQEQNTNIRWETNGLKITTVKIEMWDYSGNTKIKDVITENTEQTTLLSKTQYSIPFKQENHKDICGNSFYFKLYDLSDIAVDISSEKFSITKPFFNDLKLENSITKVNQGDSINILWGFKLIINTVKIELVKPDNTTIIIKNSIESGRQMDKDSIYNWVLPYDDISGTGYKLKISDLDNIADDFISPLSFEIIAPNFSSFVVPPIMYQDRTYNLLWDYSGNFNTVSIKLKDSNNNITDISNTILASTKQFTWKPELSKSVYGTFTMDISDNATHANVTTRTSNTFTIVKPAFNTIELKHPNSGPSWCPTNPQQNTVYQECPIDISWNTNNSTIDNVKLELWRSNNINPIKIKTIKNPIKTPTKFIENLIITGQSSNIINDNSDLDISIFLLMQDGSDRKFISLNIVAIMQIFDTIKYSGIPTKNEKIDFINEILKGSMTLFNVYYEFYQITITRSFSVTQNTNYNWEHIFSDNNNINKIKYIHYDNQNFSEDHEKTIRYEIVKSNNTFNMGIDNDNLGFATFVSDFQPIIESYILDTSGFANDDDLTNDVFKTSWIQDNSANAIHDDYYIRIFDNLDIAYDISSSIFSIVKPKLLNINVFDTQEQPVTIVNQGENFKIKWNFDLSLNNIKIDLSSNTFKKNIIDNYKISDLSYNWTPVLHKDMFGTTFKLHIYDKSNITNDISSVQFEIKKPIIGPVKLVNIDNPTTDVSQNVPINIVWRTFLTIKNAQIILTNNNGDFIQTIIDSIPGNNDFNKFGNGLSNYLWTPDLSANMFGSGFRLKIIDLSGISEPWHPPNTFTIIKPRIGPVKLVDIDNPATDVSQNVPINIVWKKKLTVKNVQIILTNANGDFIQSIVDSIPGDNDFNKFGKENFNYLWTPDISANLNGPGFRLKIIDLSGISDPWHPPNQFTIHKNKFTSLTIPSLVQQNISTNINWDFDLSVNNVQLELWSTLSTPHERKQIIDKNIKASLKNYNWNPDLSSNLSGNGFKILIKDMDNVTDDYSSNVLQIEKARFTNITVSDYVIQDIQTTINWDNTLTIENVNLELYDSSNNTFVESIVTNLPNTKSYNWKPTISNTSLGSNFHIVIKDSLEVSDDISSNTLLIIKKSFNPFLYFNNPNNTFHGVGVNMIKYERKNINDLSFNVYKLLGNVTITRIDPSITNIPNTGHIILEDDDIFDGSGNTITYLINNNNVPGLFYNASNGTSYPDGSTTRNGFLIENLQIYPPGNQLTNVGKLGMSHGTFINYDSVKNKSLWCTIRNCLVNKGTYNLDSNFKTNAAPFIGNIEFNKNNGGFVKIELSASKWLPYDISKNKILVNSNPSAFVSLGFGENKLNFVNGTDISNICILKDSVVYGEKPTFSSNDNVIAVFKNFNISENNTKLIIENCYFYDTLNQVIVNGDTNDEKLILYGIN